jgi:hypothetical protein
VPGDLYVFGVPIDAAIEWLVVRPHVDDPSLVLLAPADDFPFAGRADMPLKPEFLDRPLTVRCGEATWLPAAACPERLRVGVVPDEAVALVRQKLAALARGNLTEDRRESRVEADPEYASWLDQVALAREAVERRGDTSPTSVAGSVLRFERFTTQAPAALAEEPQVALAANSGGPLLAALAESLASETPRYSEVPQSGGTLLLTADSRGVRVAWQGSPDAEPPSLSASGISDPVTARWRTGTSPGLHRAEPAFSWVDGQIVFVIGTERPETLTVRL